MSEKYCVYVCVLEERKGVEKEGGAEEERNREKRATGRGWIGKRKWIS